MDFYVMFGDFLSFLTISSCLIAKIPQIQNIFQLKSSQGISLQSLLLEVASYSVSTLYNFTNNYRLMNYSEYIVLLIQDFAVIGLILYYKNRLGDRKTIGCTVIYAIILFLFWSNILPKSILAFLIPLCLPMSATSKILQLVEIFRQKDATSISLITWFISWFTNLTRIYTIMIDSKDFLLVMNFSISTLLSLSVFLSALYFKKIKKA
ncbi:unnamed protein product [Diamesa serratosioi]